MGGQGQESGAPEGAGDPAGSVWAKLVVALALLALWAGDTAVRVVATMEDPAFELEDPTGSLRSDPALLHGITRRIVEAGGSVPGDLRNSKQVEHPRDIDLFANFTVGQELLVAWVHGLRLREGSEVSDEPPLVETALWVMSACASAVLFGIYLLGRGVGLGRGLAWLATLAAMTLWANHRTLGFVYVREDLAWPLFVLHLGGLACLLRGRAHGVRVGPLGWVAVGTALALAHASWHGIGSFVWIEGAALGLAFVVRGWRPIDGRGLAWLLLPSGVAWLAVPVLRAQAYGLSPTVLGWLALAAMGAVPEGARRDVARRAGVALSGLIALVLLPRAVLAPWVPGLDAYDHVRDVMGSKLRHLGQLPELPGAVSFDALLLWQGPFETATLPGLLHHLGWAWIALPAAILALRTALAADARDGDVEARSRALLGLFFLLSIPAAWLVQRSIILPGVLSTVLLAAVGSRLLPRVKFAGAAAAFLLVQGGFFLHGVSRFECPWYRPVEVKRFLAEAVEAVEHHVPDGATVLSDFVNSTALLAATPCTPEGWRIGICLQPKYETDASRRDAEAFFRTFFQGTPGDLARLMRERFGTEYLLVDRWILGTLAASRRLGGLDPRAPLPPNSAAKVFLSRDPEVLESIEGFELLYRSPTLFLPEGAPNDLYRLFYLGAD